MVGRAPVWFRSSGAQAVPSSLLKTRKSELLVTSTGLAGLAMSRMRVGPAGRLGSALGSTVASRRRSPAVLTALASIPPSLAGGIMPLNSGALTVDMNRCASFNMASIAVGPAFRPRFSHMSFWSPATRAQLL